MCYTFYCKQILFLKKMLKTTDKLLVFVFIINWVHLTQDNTCTKYTNKFCNICRSFFSIQFNFIVINFFIMRFASSLNIFARCCFTSDSANVSTVILVLFSFNLLELNQCFGCGGTDSANQ